NDAAAAARARRRRDVLVVRHASALLDVDAFDAGLWVVRPELASCFCVQGDDSIERRAEIEPPLAEHRRDLERRELRRPGVLERVDVIGPGDLEPLDILGRDLSERGITQPPGRAAPVLPTGDRAAVVDLSGRLAAGKHGGRGERAAYFQTHFPARRSS